MIFLGKLKVGMKARDFNFDTPWSYNKNFFNEIKKGKTILLFLRFYGCRVCQLDMKRIQDNYEEFLKKKSQVFIVLQTEQKVIREQDHKDDIPYTIICDPGHKLYNLYSVGAIREEKYEKLVQEKVKQAELQGITKVDNGGHEIKSQLPATFIINEKGFLTYVKYGKYSGDIPNIGKMLKEI